jgi:CRISPR system Cascade subunit CasC
MSRFVQLHILTSYPPSNLNRDDTGRPKTAVVGDSTRLRISSQSLKRAWRTSDVFQTNLRGHIGTRTKEMGIEVFNALIAKGVGEKNSREWAKSIASQFGKLKSDKKNDNNEDLQVEQLVHFSPEERQAIDGLVISLAASGTAPVSGDLQLLRKQESAVDIAMFGRMLAASPIFNTEAAIQVAHAITVHKAAVEDDYFIAVDDLNTGDVDRGAAHIGEAGFGAGVFYLYICIDRSLLRQNLGGDEAGYALAEKGDQQPRTLAQAFLRAVSADAKKGENTLTRAIGELSKRRTNFDKVYGACSDAHFEIDVEAGEGTIAGLVDFVAS